MHSAKWTHYSSIPDSSDEQRYIGPRYCEFGENNFHSVFFRAIKYNSRAAEKLPPVGRNSWMAAAAGRIDHPTSPALELLLFLFSF